MSTRVIARAAERDGRWAGVAVLLSITIVGGAAIVAGVRMGSAAATAAPIEPPMPSLAAVGRLLGDGGSLYLEGRDGRIVGVASVAGRQLGIDAADCRDALRSLDDPAAGAAPGASGGAR